MKNPKGPGFLLILLILLSNFSIIALGHQSSSPDKQTCESQILLESIEVDSNKEMDAKYRLSQLLKTQLDDLYPKHLDEIKLTYFSTDDCPSCWKIEFQKSDSYLIFRLETEYEYDHPKIEKDIDENNNLYTEISLDINTSLTIPDNSITYLILQSLVGHPYHPFSKGNNLDSWKEKSEQTNTINRLIESKLSGVRKFLFVAPPGFGKSYIFSKSIIEIDKLQYGPRIYLFISEFSSITAQIKEGLEFDHPGEKIYYWEKSGDKTPVELLNSIAIDQTSKPIYLVSTIDSFLKMFKELDTTEKSKFASLLNTIVFDEAHHLPSSHVMKLLNGFFQINKEIFLIGATASPFHYLYGDLEPYFDQSYWAYLPNPEDHSTKNTVEKMIEQLKVSVERGELTRVEKIYFLSQLNYKPVNISESISITKDSSNGSQNPLPSNENENQFSISSDFYIHLTGHLYSINPIYLQSVVGSILPLIQKHNQSMIIVSSIDEANRVTQLLQLALPHLTIFPFHSGSLRSKKNNALQLAKSNKKMVFVAIKSLDEGVDLPYLSLYIDLNRTTKITTLIQRIGRLTRLANEKTEIEIACFLDINEIKLQDLAVTIQALKNKKFNGNWESNMRKSSSSKKSNPFANSLPLIYDSNWDKYLENLNNLEKKLYFFNLSKQNQFYTIDEAKKLFHGLKDVNHYSQFLKWLESEDRDKRVPVNPYKYYKDKGWTSWPDFLKNPRSLSQREIDQAQPGFRYFTHEEASQLIIKKGTLKTQRQFTQWKKSPDFPSRMPNYPEYHYKNTSWVSWSYFLTGINKKRPPRK